MPTNNARLSEARTVVFHEGFSTDMTEFRPEDWIAPSEIDGRLSAGLRKKGAGQPARQ